jgi:septal ring factor EnvC (AmiA/AmiB activator)
MPRKFRYSVLVLCSLLLVSLLHAPVPERAEGGVQKKHNKIQKDIKSKEARLKRVKKLERTTLDDIHRADMALAAVEKELYKFRAALRRTGRKIEALKEDIAALDAKIALRREFMKRRLRAMHRYDRYGDALLMLGGAEDLPQLLRRWRYLKSLTLYEREIVAGYDKDLSALRKKRSDLDGLENRLTGEEAEVLGRERALARKRGEKKRLLASVRGEKAAYEKLLRELRKAYARMEKLIRQSEKKQDYTGSGFRKYKGRLSWPAQGPVAVPYGPQKERKFNTPVFHNGIYIDAYEEASARAVYSGKVVFADWFKGYGKLVILNHGSGYHSLYGNLSEIFLKTGDIIEGDVEIGRVGASALIDRPSLYFEIRYKGKPLNPSQWLKRR